MSDNFTCLFETSGGVLHDNLDVHFSYKCAISTQISIHTLACFGLTPAASRSSPYTPFTQNTMENDDCCPEIYNSRCGISY